ncbi:NAD(+) synthase [Vibrio harveyi]|uniref:NAD(+) synthase n=1 Tax=Vibrio harveyi TaxID=669 RepID=UPI003CEBDE34
MQISTASINQIPRDWVGNIKRIQETINEAKKQGSQLLITPELSVSGYGCEDYFFEESIAQKALEATLSLDIPEGMLVTVGLPVFFGNRLYNAVALLQHDVIGETIKGLSFKKQLAMNGIHYEARWFTKWDADKVIQTSDITGYEIPVGDPIFDFADARIGFETCEESWVPNRSARTLFERGVDIIVNSSASHFAINKFETRKQLVLDGSRTFGAAYVYANLNGCEAGRAVYDGGCLIASGGKIIAQGERFHYTDSSLITAVIDLHENKLTHQMNSQLADSNKVNCGVFKLHCDAGSHPDTLRRNKIGSSFALQGDVNSIAKWEFSSDLEHEEAIRAVALGLRDWSKKTHTNGFALSLSGGADSTFVAAATYLSVYLELCEYKLKGLPVSEHLSNFAQELPEPFESKPLLDMSVDEIRQFTQDIMEGYMFTLYQGTSNSSDVTLNAAKSVAKGTGAMFDDWNIEELTKEYTRLTEGTIARSLNWEDDDIALQNIQARVRSPGIWFLANIKNKLLLTTSNMSEGAVGYVTMDGDSSGVLAPISGITKGRVLKILHWLHDTGLIIETRENPYNHNMGCLYPVINQKPTAELRPEEQNDEDDLMPFDILDRIVELFMVKRKSEESIINTLIHEFDTYEEDVLQGYVALFFRLFKRNQWKRERQAPGFHIEVNSLDPKTYGRFSLFSA